MIGRLKGSLIEKQAPHLMVDVNGVGYELLAPLTTFYVMPSLGEQVVLYTHLVVREDAHLLYGFSSTAERSVFRHLIKVNGVGPKVALAILSGMSVDEFLKCVHDNDVAGLTRLPGVGKKTAERLVVEMRDRLQELAGIVNAKTQYVPRLQGEIPYSDAAADALSALVALGYKPNEASAMIRAVNTKSLTSEEIIRQALQQAAARV